MEISLLVGLKNNLPYTKYFYKTTRELYPDIEIVLVSYGSNDGTHNWLDSLSDPNVKYYYSAENKTLSDTYKKCISLATKKYVVFLHNDMVLAQRFAEHILKDISEDKVLFYRVTEPPVFAADTHNWKIVHDFGPDTETFKIDAFRNHEKTLELKPAEATTDPAFFLAAPKSALLTINGLDPLFNPMFCEDNDLLYRLQLFGLKFYQSYNAIVYHFVSKTSRFSEEYSGKTLEIEKRSDRNFYRKWGFGINSPAKEKRQYGLVLKNADADSLRLLEPFVSKIYTSANVEAYIRAEQPFTDFNLSQKIVSEDAEKKEDILICFNARRIHASDIKTFENLSGVISKKLKSPWFNFKRRILPGSNARAGRLKIKIRNLKTYEKNLIIRK